MMLNSPPKFAPCSTCYPLGYSTTSVDTVSGNFSQPCLFTLAYTTCKPNGKQKGNQVKREPGYGPYIWFPYAPTIQNTTQRTRWKSMKVSAHTTSQRRCFQRFSNAEVHYSSWWWCSSLSLGALSRVG